MKKIIIFSAPSGSGKTTIIHKLIEKGLPLGFSISATNREPRKNEINGKDYFFFTIEEFKEKIKANEFIEWEEVYEGMFYGTLKSEIDRIWNGNKAVVFDVDVKGGVSLKNIFKNKALSIFVMPPSIEVLRERLVFRHTESEELIEKRIARARYEMEFAPKFDTIIINNNLEEAVENAYRQIKEFLGIDV